MALDCGKCLKSLKNVKQKVECNDCKQQFHYKCVSMSADDVAYLTEQGHVWRCASCSVERRKSLRLETADNISYQDVYNLVQELKSKFDDTGKSLGKSLESCHEQLREAGAAIASQSKEIASLRTSLDKATSENNLLRSTVSKLEARIDEVEQYSRRNSFEIHGVPQNDNENVINIVQQVGAALGVQIEEPMIDACHRLRAKPDSGKPPGIIVKMVRRLDTEIMLKKKREKRDLSTRHIGMAADTPVYVNESLSPGNRRLLAATRAAKNTKGYKFVWIKNGKILVRKDDGHDVVAIRSMADIERL